MDSVALVFSGPMSHPATTKLRNAICAACNEVVAVPPAQQTQRRYKNIFLLMSSVGGSIEDGFALYNFLRSIPIEVTTVNMGLIASIANVPFLAGKTRIACPDAYFHFHNFDWTYPTGHTLTRQQFTDHTQLLDIGRDKKMTLFKQHTKLTDSDLETLKFLDQPLVKDAAFAKEKGIVHEVGFPKLPVGAPIYNVDY